MGPREIPPLSVLCLRVVGNPKCKVDETFAPTKDGKPSSASRLLRIFHHRPVLGCGETMKDYFATEKEAIQELNNNNESSTVGTVPTLERIPMKRMPAIGPGSGRREQANDVDLNHPWIGTYRPMVKNEDDDEEENEFEIDDDSIPSDPQEQTLVAGSGCCALDLLQCYIDALVEMGRMDDGRLGLHFFAEFKINIQLHYKASLEMGSPGSLLNDDSEATTTMSIPEAFPPPTTTLAPVMDSPIPKKKKRKRSNGGAFSAAKKKKEAEARAAAEAKKLAAILAAVPKSRGSLSLHNCQVMTNTTSNLLNSRVLEHIHVLDLTGLQTLTDATLLPLLKSAGLQLERLSLKNCRRLTDITVHNMCENCSNLKAIDIGGDYNIEPLTLLDALAVKVTKRGRGIFSSQALKQLVELHAGGIGPTGGWTDDHLPQLFAMRGWKALSIGFSPYLSFAGWKKALLSVEQTHKEEEQQQEQPQTSNSNNKNMRQTLQSLGIAFCEQQLVDNAWLGLVGRHLPNLRALDVRGNHHLHSMTSWYDGRATIGHTVHPKQSLVVLARYSGISVNGIEETKRIYPLAAAPLRVVTESDGIGWGILRQEQQASPELNNSSKHRDHYQYRLAVAKKAAKERAKVLEAAKATPETSATSKIVAVVVPPEEDVAPESATKEASSGNDNNNNKDVDAAVAMETTD